MSLEHCQGGKSKKNTLKTAILRVLPLVFFWTIPPDSKKKKFFFFD